jgi:hypothetical protein
MLLYISFYNNFLAKLAFFLKYNVMVIFLPKYLSRNRQIFSSFSEFFLIITLTTGLVKDNK